jgi:hypothetical protein
MPLLDLETWFDLTTSERPPWLFPTIFAFSVFIPLLAWGVKERQRRQNKRAAAKRLQQREKKAATAATTPAKQDHHATMFLEGTQSNDKEGPTEKGSPLDAKKEPTIVANSMSRDIHLGDVH